jgi:hypothetical protein
LNGALQIPSNRFWGLRYGGTHKDGSLGFMLPKGGTPKGKHSGPSGKRATRFYAARNLVLRPTTKKPTKR